MSEMTQIYSKSERLKKLPPYLFVEVDRMKRRALEEGVDIINLGVGDPDTPTAPVIREKMKEAVDNKDNHQYPFGKGKEIFRKKIRDFMQKRFNLELKEDQVHSLIGSKEGIAHLPLAFVNPSDVVLVPEPAYPVYNSSAIFAGGTPYYMPLKEENSFLPRYQTIPEEILEKARILFINYPNNPTGASATGEFYLRTVEIARKYSIIVASDAAYSELYYKDKPASFLQTPGAMDVGIEFHSLSKTFSMTGWRVGWACGSSKIVSGLASVKDNIDSGIFGAVQDAACIALDNYEQLSNPARETYKERMEILTGYLKEASWKLEMPRASFYLWARPPGEISSIEAVKKLISEAGVICTPGSGFGPSGRGYVRFAATRKAERIREAGERIKKIKW